MTQYKFTIDPTAYAGYLTMHEGQFERTVQVSPEILIDYDTSGNLLGIEFLSLESIENFNPDSLSSQMSAAELSEIKVLLSGHLDFKTAVAESRQQDIPTFTQYLISI